MFLRTRFLAESGIWGGGGGEIFWGGVTRGGVAGRDWRAVCTQKEIGDDSSMVLFLRSRSRRAVLNFQHSAETGRFVNGG